MSELEGLSHEQIAGPPPERRVLSNGLEVLFCHRPGIGLCTVQAWVRTGSVDEGRWEGSGISHYLEHMVFKGTERFTGRQLTEAVHRAGGTSNAYTTFDRTVYYVDAPEEGFETAMEAVSRWSSRRCSPMRTPGWSGRSSSGRSPCATTTTIRCWPRRSWLSPCAAIPCVTRSSVTARASSPSRRTTCAATTVNDT
ncbi:MAG: M16 family metallopeptidase [Verrucomicrobiota bacterium]